MKTEERKISPALLIKVRKEEKRIEWERRKEERDERNFWGQSTLHDSYLRAVGHLLGIILFLYFATLLSTPILLLINKVYPPLAHPYVVVGIICAVGYGLWRYLKWAR